MSTLSTIIQRGTSGAQPSAASVPVGTLYFQTDTNAVQRSNGASWDSFSGSSGSKIVQIVNSETGAVATGTTIIPADDTIPQNTEGTQFLSLAITPSNAANNLMIDVILYVGSTLTPLIIVALFQDTTANALAATAQFNPFSGDSLSIAFRHVMVAGTTSPTTFKVRIGPSSAATITLNGQTGGRFFGGVAASSITITEYAP